ncbi:cytochrome c [Thalassomonas actiniarum]|uniref:Cytochrome c n=1 Tax=Thalassomonas actiniarum TaxID=485447 RepID=A0AAF0C397_9GAMM|nr:cytochrome c [Thalassomonas actiniarum]WDD98710.1 cytochrome c [Thalassomonas actiniarum]
MKATSLSRHSFSRRLKGAVLSLAVFGGTAVAQAAQDQAGLIAQGKYLAEIGDCVACHTPQGGRELSGGLPFETPFGIVYSTNITSDKETGIGHYSYQDFYRAMHEGISPNGNLYPAMPYTSYHLLTDADTRALYAYFMNTKPISQENKDSEIGFPFNIRMGLKAWNLMNHEDSVFTPDPAKSDSWNRGSYLVNVLGHCGECHTPRNAIFAMDPTAHFQGTVLDTFEASNITPEELNRQNWTHEDLKQLFTKGYSRKGTVFGGMYPVVYHSYSHLTEQDMRAVTSYLLDNEADIEALPLAFNGHDKAAPGYNTYMGYCAGCHGQDGEGRPNVAPALAGNATLDRTSVYNAVSLLLNGIVSQHYNSTTSFYAMPAYADKFDDQQLTDLVNYMRTTWTAQKADIGVSKVKDIRTNMKQSVH